MKTLKLLSLWFCALLPAPLSADVSLNTATLALVFSEQGSLLQADVCYPSCAHEAAQRLELRQSEGIISFGQTPGAVWVQRRGLPGLQADRDQQLHFTGPKGQSVSWIIPDEGFRIEATVANTGALEMRAGAGFGSQRAAGFGAWLEQVRYVAVGSNGMQQIGLQEDKTSQVFADWAGFRNRFWAVLASGHEEGSYAPQTGAENKEAVLRRADDLQQEHYAFYLGPVEPRVLSTVDELLNKLLYSGLWFWLRWISFALYYLLGWIHSVVPVWGVAIMLLSLVVHVLMLPLSRVADRVQQQVNATEARLAPELSRIRTTSRGEQQAAKIIALYKNEKVHPLYSLKSLLGVAIVIPVFIGAFDMLAENIHLLNAGFLWITDLSRPDAWAQLPFSLPFFGRDLNLLPLLMTGLSVAASMLHRPAVLSAELRARQARNMTLLAVLFFLLFYTFPAGMVLYWTTNNLISAGKSLWARGQTAVKTRADDPPR